MLLRQALGAEIKELLQAQTVSQGGRGVQTPVERQWSESFPFLDESGKFQGSRHKKGAIKVSRDDEEEESRKASHAEGIPRAGAQGEEQ